MGLVMFAEPVFGAELLEAAVRRAPKRRALAWRDPFLGAKADEVVVDRERREAIAVGHPLVGL